MPIEISSFFSSCYKVWPKSKRIGKKEEILNLTLDCFMSLLDLIAFRAVKECRISVRGETLYLCYQQSHPLSECSI